MALPTLVLLPGLDGTGRNFAPLVSALAVDEQALVVAYPDAPAALFDLVEHVRGLLPDGPYLLVAESFSGPVGITLARDAPEGCVGLVLVATFARHPIRAPRLLARLLAPVIFALAPPRFAVRQLLVGPDAHEQIVQAVIDAIRSQSPQALTARVGLITRVDARPALRGVAVPILYLQASHDRLVSARNVDELLAIRPDIRMVQIATAHLVLQTEPGASLDAIRAWWSDVCPDPRQ